MAVLPQHPTEPPRALPFTVLAGYLGAGKTTLLNRLLTADHGQRLAVLVNDFGSVDVDASLIAAHDGTTISMANGCACCTIGDDLGAAITQVLDMGVFDRIVLEASGVADPRPLAAWATLPGLELDAVVVLADASTITRRVDDRYVGSTVRAQLAAADLLVLTKIDQVDAAAVADATTLLRSVNPIAELVHSEHGGAADVLLALHRAARPPSAADEAPVHATDVHETATVTADLPCDRAALVDLLTRAPGLVRAKGIVRCRIAGGRGTGDAPTLETVLVQATDRVTVQSLPEGTPATGLVLVGIAAVADLPALVRALTADRA